MPRYANGQIPYTALVKFGAGFSNGEAYEWWTSPASLARLNQLIRLGRDKYGVTLRVTPGWNAYRPLDVQKRYRARLGIMAAVPGFSSHGGSLNGSDCLAFDIGNWADLAPGNPSLAWARFVALCKAAGFTTDFVKPREQWHTGDFNPWAAPSFASVVIKPHTTSKPDAAEEEDDMKSKYSFGHRNESGYGDEWMLVGADLKGPGAQVGFLTTTDAKKATAWGRLYSTGQGAYDFDVSRVDYIDIQSAATEVYNASHPVA